MTMNLQKQEKGFTIIEVLIVLAIAGLIILIVFLAVPALQRNSRNTQYKNEISAIIGSYNEISNNQNGKVLTASISTTANSDAKKVLDGANARNITRVDIEAYTATAAAPTLDKTIIRTGSKCTAGDSATPAQGSTRQVAVFFKVESTAAGGETFQCQEA